MEEKKLNKVEVRDWRIIDIYWNDEDGDMRNKVVAQYEKKGYHVENEDNGTHGYANCTQLYKDTVIKEVKR